MLTVEERRERNRKIKAMADSGFNSEEISASVGMSSRTIRYILNPEQAKAMGRKVSEWRRRAKETLVLEAGSKCVDCTGEFPPFMMDFDHRDPAEKEFGIGQGPKGSIVSLDRLRAEAAKCDLVCSNCHRMRTHKQRCSGCKYCDGL